jgi:cysteine desulfurase family protein (TIGR01976 family)
MTTFPVEQCRHQFLALRRIVEGRTPVYLDGPGGTQVPQRVIDAIVHYLSTCNANHGGAFTTSCESDAILHQAHQTAADLLNAPSPDEVVFGPNMTTLTFHLSRSIARTLRPGDEILVTRLDHDANVRPWVLAARDAGATARFIDIHPEDCTLDLDDLRRQLSGRTKLLAVAAASNAVGTVNDIAALTQMAHDVGAKVFVDAVHYAPHGPIDVQAWDCDFLACSAYKFFGPHVGILWGKCGLLYELEPYKVRPAVDTLPDRWETGTQNHEGLAGVVAAVEYLADLGGRDLPRDVLPSRDRKLRHALTAIRAYETELVGKLLKGLAERPRFKVWGITDPARLDARVPTVSITAADRFPRELARHLAERQIYVWDGNLYALELSERLGLEPSGGFLRLGLVHYNTTEEVDRLLQALDEL